LLKWIAWNSFEFEKAGRVSGYSCFDPCAFSTKSYYNPFWCQLYSSSDHAIDSCRYYACYAQLDFVSLVDNTDIVLTLPNSSFALAQCLGLKAGEPFRGVANLVFFMHVLS